MKVRLPYGRSSIVVRCPPEAAPVRITKKSLPKMNDPLAAVTTALRSSSSARPLNNLGKSHKTACILVCDITRPVPNSLFLTPLLDDLVDSGIHKENIVILIATGLHRPNEGDELREVIGDDDVLRRVAVENHYAERDSDHVDIGSTSTGIPVKLDRRFVEADLKIATGLVEPHFMAGYSGGRKVIAPGIAHADTIRALHCARILEHPGARQCNLENNPLHREQLEIAQMLSEFCKGSTTYALNTVINDDRDLVYVNFGEIVASHLKAVSVAERSCTIPVRRKFQTILTSAAGFPLDQTYYQTVKCMITPLEIAADDARLIVAAECAEGLGSDAFRESQQRLIRDGPEQFLKESLRKRFADVDEWESEMQLRAQRQVQVQLYAPTMPDADKELTGVEMIDSLEEAIADSVQSAEDKSVAVIADGPYVIPRLV